MAVKNSGLDITVAAAADLSAGQYRFIVHDANGRGTFAGSGAGSAIGILQNKPSGTNAAARVRYDGVSKMVAGAAITIGAFIQSNPQGFGTAAAGTGDRVRAQALMGCGGSGDLIDVMLVDFKN